ncbi:MAG: type I 3-dehydroquinate dehydratase [Halobacteriales archaeon]|nr:type I 3-dehydroquinate dehydratase [Halobacteriales archaeon]
MTLDLSSPLVVAAVSEDAPRKAREARDEGADAVEVRIDMYDDRDIALEDLRDCDALPAIATNRATDEQTEDERVETLVSATEHAEAVDIDISSPDDSIERVVEAAREEDATVIASHHDFDGTPRKDEMWDALERGWEVGDVAKLAVTAGTRRDAHRLLELTLDADDEGDEAGGHVATMAMGALGSHTRVVAPLYGSCLTYASYGEGTAPGQLSVREVREMFDMLR